MGRYLGPKCRLCRREGMKLYLKGERCYSPKCPIDRKGAAAPGAHKYTRRKPSSYGLQLRAKQKLKRVYFVNERQLKNYFKEALQAKGDSGENLLRLLELRLDSVIYRSGLVASRTQARQYISHGFVEVDKKKVSIPSYRLKKDQVVIMSVKSLKTKPIKTALEKKSTIPGWLDKKAHVVRVNRIPSREDFESEINDRLIVEYYSR